MVDRLREQPAANIGDGTAYTEALRREFPGLPDFHRWEIKAMFWQSGVQDPNDRDVLNYIRSRRNGDSRPRVVDNGAESD